MGLLQKWGKHIGDTWNRATGQGARDREKEAQRKQLEMLQGLEETELNELQAQIPELANLGDEGKLQLQGLLDLAKTKAHTVDGTAYDSIKEDPSLRKNQLSSLDKLKEYTEKGRTAQDEAALQDLLSKSRQDDRGRRLAIDSQMKRRGLAGSGLDLMAKLQSKQAASNLASKNALDLSANRETQKLNASQMLGNLSGQVRGQDYQMASDKANAQDLLNRFNSSLKQGVENQNIAYENQQRQHNLSERQRVADANAQYYKNRTAYNNQNKLARYGLLSQKNQYNNNVRRQMVEDRNANRLRKAGFFGDKARSHKQNYLSTGDQMQLIGSLVNGGAALMGGSKGGAGGKTSGT